MIVTGAAPVDVLVEPAAPPARPARWRWGRLRHEWTWISLGAVALSVLVTWPTMRHPTRTIPGDTGDPTMQAWQMAWSGHALRTDPTSLWQANAFHPEPTSFAFTDTLLGYAPAGLIGTGPVAALLRYNIIFVLAFALAFVGAYALVRQLGAGRVGAAVAGAGFAYAPWRLAQVGHLQVLSTGGIALALAMLARGHGWSLRHGYRPERARPGWAVGGWCVAAWQLSLGFGIGVPFGYALALAALVAVAGWLWRRPPLPRRLLLADGAGLAVFLAVAAFMARPYLLVAEQFPYVRRSWEDLRVSSPPLRGFFTSPNTSILWGDLSAGARAALGHRGETSLLPGFLLYGLAALGLVLSIWTLRQRLLLAAGVVASIVLAMGTEGPAGGRYTYGLVYVLPGFDGIRTPGRLVIWTTLLLAILAAGAVTALATRARPVRVMALLLPLLVVAEGVNTTGHPPVPAPPPAIATAPAPFLVLPSGATIDGIPMLWATDRFPEMVNGAGAFTTPRQVAIREATVRFPDEDSVALLRATGVRSVVVVRTAVVGTPYESTLSATTDGLPVRRVDTPEAVVYLLDPA
ncbi:hypothetical protein [Asanoa iriomotensis]|uniref:hypothetical protein n=1 Tax=Asanoa iriomotensis TaxID=234613 RepID=UPI0019444E8B|nr:hypothetical protein [Asanoa iriomotensis]